MDDRRSDRIVYALAAMTGAVIFVALYGIQIINPAYDEWLLTGGDLMQHYLGWCFYRRGDWTFPIGMMDQLAYPSYTSVIFTDSIPLFAVFFKLLSPLLPDTFQYFGLWGILCFMLQGYFAAKILRALSVGRPQTLIGCVFFILSPTVLEKMFRHTALGGHWIILAAIYLFIQHGKMYREIKRTTVYWGIIGGLVAAIHLYFLPMCGMFLGGYICCSFLRGYMEEHKLRPGYLLPGVSFVAGLFLSTWLLGGFTSGAEAGGAGLGEASFNLNGFFNSKGYSRLFDALPTYKDLQYEGFAYLGLGIFILVFMALCYIVYCLVFKKVRRDRPFWIYGVMYVLMSLGLILFAASPQVTFNDKLLYALPYSSTLYHYWGIFRSTGRMVWPVCYLIFIGAVLCCDRFLKDTGARKTVPCIVLGICVLAQVYDLSGKLVELREKYSIRESYESPLQSDIWDKIAATDRVEHIVWASTNYENAEIMHMAKYAYDNGMTMNTYYFARAININENTKNSIENLSDNCVYIFRTFENDNDKYDPHALDLYLYDADGYIVGTTFLLE